LNRRPENVRRLTIRWSQAGLINEALTWYVSLIDTSVLSRLGDAVHARGRLAPRK
jgi:hypothetical protein